MTGEDRVRAVMRPGESLLWWGVPARRRFLGETVAQVVLGAIPFALGTLVAGFAGWHLWQGGLQPRDLGGNLFGGTIGLIFVAIGIYCWLYPLMMGSRLSEVVYAITDQRGLVLTSPSTLWNPVPAQRLGDALIEFSPEQIRSFKRRRLDFGRTDLIFHQEWKRAHKGGQWWYYGFLGLAEPGEVEQVIRRHGLESGLPVSAEPVE